MITSESDLTPLAVIGAVRSFYFRLRTTFDWSGIFAIVIQAMILALAFGSGAALLLLLIGALVTAASVLRSGRFGSSLHDNSEPRSWRNAVANAGVATGFAMLSLLVPSAQLQAIFAVASVASLAASLSDSLSHEIGVLYGGKPRLITTWSQTEPGENGAISLVGSAVGIFSAFALAGMAVLVGVIGIRAAGVAAAAACCGNLIDSILGATIQRRGWLDNDGVNFSAVSSSSILVLAAFLVLNFT